MKKLWLKVLSCFMAVNFMFMCFAMPVSAGKVNYRLNGKGDELDIVLNSITDMKEWQALDKICKKGIFRENGKFTQKYYGYADTFNLSSDRETLVAIFNKEIRSNYGNTFANMFRNTMYSPGYGKILIGVAKKLDLVIPDKIDSNDDVIRIEKEIRIECIKLLRNKVISEKGYAEWDKLEKQIIEKTKKDISDGKIKGIEVDEFMEMASGGILGILGAAGALGSVGGFLTYQIANMTFFGISSVLGLGIGVATGGPIVAGLVQGLINPLFWIPCIVGGAYLLGDTNWEKTIGIVLFVLTKRENMSIKEEKQNSENKSFLEKLREIMKILIENNRTDICRLSVCVS